MRSLTRLETVLFLLCAAPDAIVEHNQSTETSFFVKIDTETSAGCTKTGCKPESITDRILGQGGDEYFRLSLMMDILDNYGMKDTFFVDAYLNSHYPESDIKNVVRQTAATTNSYSPTRNSVVLYSATQAILNVGIDAATKRASCLGIH